ncbi:hypothetical protein J7438_24755 [Thalassotalea sp. G20_0]|uniref:hypothetical protein n=1 Tax=Thalassotalea sp. G20_0 TaxID=2821093 RepID=UPI001AD97E1D|nr:hypothetical protein [Thalassotalea sp. G20_0]MBO9497270.1 hypothetical protein [Thalassotalea sp. G20_0]
MQAPASGGGEVKGTIDDTTAVNCTVTTNSTNANAGIGGGLVASGKVTNTMAVGSNVTTSGEMAHAGIGGGTFMVEEQWLPTPRRGTAG